MRVGIIFIYQLILIYEKMEQVNYKIHENKKMILISKFFMNVVSCG
ncbi:hypothetical protein EMIT079MI2_160027 [Bacillus sp. IT-79MI2]